MSKHRRISGVPSSAARAQVGVRSTSVRVLHFALGVNRPGKVGGGFWVARDKQIDRPVDPSPRAVKGATASSPSPALWSPGRRGRADRFLLAAAPVFSPPTGVGQTVHNPARGVDMPDRLGLWAHVYDHSNSSCVHALCVYRRSALERADVVGIDEGSFLEGPLSSPCVSVNSPRASRVCGSANEHATTLPEHTFAFKGSGPEVTKLAHLPQRFRGIAKKTWRENELRPLREAPHNPGIDQNRNQNKTNTSAASQINICKTAGYLA